MPVNLQQYRVEWQELLTVVSTTIMQITVSLIEILMSHQQVVFILQYLQTFACFCFFVSFCLIILFRKNNKTINLLANKILFIYMLSTYLFHVWLCSILMKRSGDIEQNPGPKPRSCQSFSVCHWNLNSILAHNFIKLSPLRPYITVHKFDVVC